MRRAILLAGLAGLIIGGATALWITQREASPQADAPPPSTGRALIGGPFELVDTTGKRVSDKDLRGKPMLVMFGFTHCPDICPAGLQLMSAALDKLGDKTDRVTPVFITLDPERDTPEVLADYKKSFHPSIRGLTGTPEEVAVAAKAYRVYFKKVPTGSGDGYSIDHSSFFYLMDARGAFVRHFPHASDPDAIAGAIAALG